MLTISIKPKLVEPPLKHLTAPISNIPNLKADSTVRVSFQRWKQQLVYYQSFRHYAAQREIYLLGLVEQEAEDREQKVKGSRRQEKQGKQRRQGAIRNSKLLR
ncbi:MAG: hypothetical protein KME45_20190 [Stenomitos rutilans HA7619-LM2]|nr:hypothetical protein [Stenomitos rutilans HA7619-LM2]